MTAARRRRPRNGAGASSRTSTVGDVYRSRLGRTITETDNIWFTCLTLNTNQMHFNTPYAERHARSGGRSSTAPSRSRS